MCSHVARQRFERTSDGAIALALRVPLLNSHAAGPPSFPHISKPRSSSVKCSGPVHVAAVPALQVPASPETSS